MFNILKIFKKKRKYTDTEQARQAHLLQTCSEDAVHIISLIGKRLDRINDIIVEEMDINTSHLSESDAKLVNINLAKTYDKNIRIIDGLNKLLGCDNQ